MPTEYLSPKVHSQVLRHMVRRVDVGIESEYCWLLEGRIAQFDLAEAGQVVQFVTNGHSYFVWYDRWDDGTEME